MDNKLTNIKERVLQIAKIHNISYEKFCAEIGITYGNFKGKNKNTPLNSDTIANILSLYPRTDSNWLLTGEGEIFKNTCDTPIVSYTGGVPYYDVDFIGGYDIVENDQTLRPVYNIDFEPYNKADSWVNITGHSMEPTINHGDIIALKRMNDWNTYLLYGEIYAIVTDEYRTVKRVCKSDLGTDYIRLVPVNDRFDEQDIRRDIIRHVYQVIGGMRRFF